MTITVHYAPSENIQNIYEILMFCCPDVAWGSFLLSFAEDGDHLWVTYKAVSPSSVTYRRAASESRQAPEGNTSTKSS